MSREVCLEVCDELAIDGALRRGLGSRELTPPYARCAPPHGARRPLSGEGRGQCAGRAAGSVTVTDTDIVDQERPEGRLARTTVSYLHLGGDHG